MTATMTALPAFIVTPPASLDAAREELARLEAIYQPTEKQYYEDMFSTRHFDADAAERLHVMTCEVTRARGAVLDLERASRPEPRYTAAEWREICTESEREARAAGYHLDARGNWYD